MLVDGQFIKEPPPKIGVYHTPNGNRGKATPEEVFVQDLMLGHMPYTTSFWKQLVSKVLAV